MIRIEAPDKEEFKAILEEYKFQDIWSDDCIYALNYLDVVDKTILLLYAETGSLREVSRRLAVSHSTINTKIKEIQERVKKHFP